MNTITTFTGKHFNPAIPQPEQIDILDIAHSLSLICRANGQTSTFYSVAQHSITCAKEAQARKLPAKLQLACLLHDAAVAYLSDVPLHLKPLIPGYQTAEHQLLSLIYSKFLGSVLTVPEQAQLKQIDKALMYYDLKYLLNEPQPEPEPPLLIKPDYSFIPFETTERQFLQLFNELSPAHPAPTISSPEQIKAKLHNIKAFVLDMDGTIYLGEHLFPFTKDFLSATISSGRQFYFFTNNSSKSAAAYLAKLHRMGIPATTEQMLTSSAVAFDFLSTHHKGEKAFIVGTPDFAQAATSAGIPISDTNPDFVLLAFDTSLNYEKISKACDFVHHGTPIFGVNPDLNCPTETGYIPDCGAIAQLIKASTGIQCEFFGKPSPLTLDFIFRHTRLQPDQLCIVGDRLYTDIALVQNSSVTSVLTLSGEAALPDIAFSRAKPDLIVNSIADIIPCL